MDIQGSNLQQLIDGNCITPKSADELTTTQIDAIEKLTPGQVRTLIDVQKLVGKVKGAQMI